MAIRTQRAEDINLKVSWIAGLAALVFSLPVNLNQHLVSLTGGSSLSAACLTLSIIATIVIFVYGYITYALRMYKTSAVKIGIIRLIFDGVFIGVGYVLLSAAVSLLILIIFIKSFTDITFDPFTASILTGIFIGAVSYGVMVLVSRISLQQVVDILSFVLIGGVLLSVLTTPNPYWWQDNFSSLGMLTSATRISFNFSLIYAGIMMIVLSTFLFQNLAQKPTYAKHKGKLLILQIIIILIGICFACIGFFPFRSDPTQTLLHTVSALGALGGFFVLILSLHILVPTISKHFLIISYIGLVVILAFFILYNWFHYLSTTTFELFSFSFFFIWLVLFLRNITSEPLPAKGSLNL